MGVPLRFDWHAGQRLAVRYRRLVREEGQRPGHAAAGRDFDWIIEAVDDGLRLRPERVRMSPPEDDRTEQPHRALLDGLIDAPPDLRIDREGGLVGLHDPAALAATAGISTAALRALPADARRLIAGLAHPTSLEALAADFWNSLVGSWLDLGTVPDTPISGTVNGQLPMLGMPARFVLTRSAEVAENGLRLTAVTEALQTDVEAALKTRPSPIDALVVESRTTLETDPATLVPRTLEVRRLQQVAVRGQIGSQLDVRTWIFS